MTFGDPMAGFVWKRHVAPLNVVLPRNADVTPLALAGPSCGAGEGDEVEEVEDPPFSLSRAGSSTLPGCQSARDSRAHTRARA